MKLFIFTSLPLLFTFLFLKFSHAALSDSIKLDSTSKARMAFLIEDKKTSIKNESAKNLLLTGSSYEKLNSFNEAESYYRQAFAIYVKSNSTAESANVALRLSKVLYQKKQYTEGAKYATHAIKNFERLGLNNGMAAAYLQLALINRKLGVYSKSESYILTRTLPLFNSEGNKKGRLECFEQLGYIYFDQKKYSQAKWFFIQQNILAGKLKDTVAIINSLSNLGRVKTDIKHYDLALADYKEAEKLVESAGLKTDFSNEIAKIYTRMGKPEMAAKVLAATKSKNKLKEYYMEILKPDVDITNPNSLFSVSDNHFYPLQSINIE